MRISAKFIAFVSVSVRFASRLTFLVFSTLVWFEKSCFFFGLQLWRHFLCYLSEHWSFFDMFFYFTSITFLQFEPVKILIWQFINRYNLKNCYRNNCNSILYVDRKTLTVAIVKLGDIILKNFTKSFRFYLKVESWNLNCRVIETLSFLWQ